MNILYITNVYPSQKRNMSPIVKNIIKYYNIFCKDKTFLEVIERTNFIKTLFSLRKYIKRNKIDIIHIHFGGLYAFLILLFIQGTRTKKIITFHGTDIHGELYKQGAYIEKTKIKINKFFSLFSFILVDKIDFVSQSLIKYIPKKYSYFFKNKYNISTLGVCYNQFKPIDMNTAKMILNLDKDTNYILFVNNNNSLVKREEYAIKIIQGLGKNFKMLRLENIPYEKLYLYFNACLFLLITSENEGSPNIVREALACNLPIVSVDVGDIKNYIEKTTNSFLIEKYDYTQAIFLIKRRLSKLRKRENTREIFEKEISFQYTSKKLHELYYELLKQKDLDE